MNAGWHEMDVWGTTSSVAVVGSGAMGAGRAMAAVLGRMEGRRVGREEKSLLGHSWLAKVGFRYEVVMGSKNGTGGR